MDSSTLKLVSQLKKDYKVSLHEACFSEGVIPRFIILDKTRNIHSYIDFYNCQRQSIRGEIHQSNVEIKEKLIKFCQIQFSSLDRPFFLHVDKYEDSFFIDISDLRIATLKGELNIESIDELRIDKSDLFAKIKSEL